MKMKMMMACVLCAGMSLLGVSAARAQELSLYKGQGQGVMILPGLSGGAALYRAGQEAPSLMVGGELSVVWFNTRRSPTALGGYADWMWHVSQDLLRFHAGPELSWLPFGADVAYVMERSPQGWSHGVSARVFMSALVPGMYLRAGWLWGGQPGGYVELGGTLKLPLYRRD